MKFNKEEWIKKLKIELGLSAMPDEELKNYKIDFMQTVGQVSEDDMETKMSAQEYIDIQLENIEQEYKLIQESLNDGGVSAPTIDSKPVQLLNPIDMNTSYSNMKYYQIQFPDTPEPFIVVVPTNTWDYASMVANMENNPFTVGQISPDLITGNERLISYYQFANRVQELAPVNTRELLPVDHILNNLATQDLEGGIDKNILNSLFYGNNG